MLAQSNGSHGAFLPHQVASACWLAALDVAGCNQSSGCPSDQPENHQPGPVTVLDNAVYCCERVNMYTTEHCLHY